MRPTLFETMRVERGVVVRLERHLARLEASADYFGIPFDGAAARRALDEAIARSERADLMRARLDLSADGAITALARPHDPGLPPGGARVVFAGSPVDRGDVRLYHKCADRARYDAAIASAPGMFDVRALERRRAKSTELTRANLVVELDGRRLTPPVDCGLLGGVASRGAARVGERSRSASSPWMMCARAERLWFVNSLRGWVPIALPIRSRRATSRR